MLESNTRKETIQKFMFVLNMISFALFITYYTKKTTVLILISTTLVIIMFYFFLYYIFKKCEDTYLINIQYISLFFTLFFVPFFYSSRNIGTPIVYVIFLTLVGLLLLIRELAEWLLVPISILCAFILPDYIFLFFNIFLYLLIYKIINSTDKYKRNKYVEITILSLISVCTIFLYLKLTHSVDTTILDNFAYCIYHLIELPIFCIFMLPYLILGIRLFKNILLASTCKEKRKTYILIPIMSLFSAPCYFTNVNSGPVIFSVTAYYALIILTLCALNDKLILEQLHLLMEDIKHRYKYSAILLVYVATMIPFYDMHINQVLYNIINWLDTNFLHLL